MSQIKINYAKLQKELQKEIDTLDDDYKIVLISHDDGIFKVVKNNKTAVLLAGTCGSGWSTWNRENPMDARFIVLFLKNEINKMVELCKTKSIRYDGLKRLRIQWIETGEKIKINEYDGMESIANEKGMLWHIT
jgi:hypothetical protein